MRIRPLRHDRIDGIPINYTNEGVWRSQDEMFWFFRKGGQWKVVPHTRLHTHHGAVEAQLMTAGLIGVHFDRLKDAVGALESFLAACGELSP